MEEALEAVEVGNAVEPLQAPAAAPATAVRQAPIPVRTAEGAAMAAEGAAMAAEARQGKSPIPAAGRAAIGKTPAMQAVNQGTPILRAVGVAMLAAVKPRVSWLEIVSHVQ
jgi:hypothetical protein